MPSISHREPRACQPTVEREESYVKVKIGNRVHIQITYYIPRTPLRKSKPRPWSELFTQNLPLLQLLLLGKNRIHSTPCQIPKCALHQLENANLIPKLLLRPIPQFNAYQAIQSNRAQ